MEAPRQSLATRDTPIVSTNRATCRSRKRSATTHLRHSTLSSRWRLYGIPFSLAPRFLPSFEIRCRGAASGCWWSHILKILSWNSFSRFQWGMSSYSQTVPLMLQNLRKSGDILAGLPRIVGHWCSILTISGSKECWWRTNCSIRSRTTSAVWEARRRRLYLRPPSPKSHRTLHDASCTTLTCQRGNSFHVSSAIRP